MTGAIIRSCVLSLAVAAATSAVGCDDSDHGPGMFACELTSECEQIDWHLDQSDNELAVRCAAALVVAGRPGVISALEAPGPGDWEEETLVLVEGDGTVLVQSRERSCDSVVCDLATRPWGGYSSVQRCDIAGVDALKAECAAGTSGCRWWPWDNLEGCVDVEAPACEELRTDVEGP